MSAERLIRKDYQPIPGVGVGVLLVDSRKVLPEEEQHWVAPAYLSDESSAAR